MFLTTSPPYGPLPLGHVPMMLPREALLLPESLTLARFKLMSGLQRVDGGVRTEIKMQWLGAALTSQASQGPSGRSMSSPALSRYAPTQLAPT